MKRKLHSALSLFLLLPFLAGCVATAAHPPTALETKLFDIGTNLVPVIETRTNTVWETNTVIQTILQTNTVGVVVPVPVTNFVTVPIPVVHTITNLVPVYDYSKGQAAASVQQTVAAIGNAVSPGVGTIAGGAASFLLSAWVWLRSRRSARAAANCSQAIETARELLKSLPNGSAYDQQLTNWMQQHQAQAGVLQDVLKLLENNVSNPAARGAAQQIAAAVAALQPKS